MFSWGTSYSFVQSQTDGQADSQTDDIIMTIADHIACCDQFDRLKTVENDCETFSLLKLIQKTASWHFKIDAKVYRTRCCEMSL